jgi:hypothetical protein
MLGMRSSSRTTGSLSSGDDGTTHTRSCIRMNSKSRDDDDDDDDDNNNNQHDVGGSDIDAMFRPGDKILVEVVSFGPMVRVLFVVVVFAHVFVPSARILATLSQLSLSCIFFI